MFGWRDVGHFHFAWPWILALLVFIPLFWMLYARDRRRRLEAMALQFSYTALVEQLGRKPAAWRRFFFPLVISLLMLLLVLGAARPTVVARVPVNALDMMLVLDISLSMMADDIQPDRLSAARDSAVRFVESLPHDVRIGLEVFAGDNYVLSPPTTRHEEVTAYLRALRKEDLKPRTEIGEALQSALLMLAREQENMNLNARNHPQRAVVLLSDGDNTGGYPPVQAARDALKDKVTLYTIGIGSAEGDTITYRGLELPVTFNEATLRDMAAITGGDYFRVFKESDFRKVYEQIHERSVRYEARSVDLGFLCSTLALLTLLGALAVWRVARL